MKSSLMLCSVAALAALTVSCSSTTPSGRVDMNESHRFVGRENNVRVDAQMTSRSLGNNASVRIVYEIENFRDEPIALVAGRSDTSFDPATGVLTISLGAEIPPSESLLVDTIHPGERKSFSTVARSNVIVANHERSPRPRYVRVRVNFLGDLDPFGTVIGPSGMIAEGVSDELFPVWIERNEVVLTNSLPIDWGRDRSLPTAAASQSGSTRIGAPF
jgi:hypothetical protein